MIQFWISDPQIWSIKFSNSLKMLQNDVFNANGANTISSADPNDNNVDEFVRTIVDKLAREVADSASQRALKDPEHGEKEILGLRVVKYKNNDSDLLCDVIRKMDAIQCGLWDYHDGKSWGVTRNTSLISPKFRYFQTSQPSKNPRNSIYKYILYLFLVKTQDRMYEAGIRHLSVQQPRPRTRSPARSPGRSPGLQARRRMNSQPDSIIDLT